MGACLSICTGKAGEAKKATGFQTIDTDARHSEGAPLLDDRSHPPTRESDDGGVSGLSGSSSGGTSSSLLVDSRIASASGSSSPLDALDAERLKNLREEQARLDLLVATTGRDMVAVRSTRGSTGYYDQGFAAALAQHLEQTTEFPNKLPQRLPPMSSSQINVKDGTASSSHKLTSIITSSAAAAAGNNSTSSSVSALYAILSQPMWEDIVLGPSQEGLAGCGGESPSQYMDRVAESILDAAVPTKEELFAGLGPMVENLL